jgi:hypothetical protein
MSQNTVIDFFKNSELFEYLKTDDKFRNGFISLSVVGAIVLAATIMFFVRATITDMNVFSGQVILYGGIVAIALIFTIFDPSSLLFQQLDGVKFYLIYMASFSLAIYFLVTYYNELSASNKATFTSFTNGFLIVLPFITLAIFFIVFKNFLKTITGWPGFFIKLIFYLPCLIIDVIEAVKQDIKSTTNTVLILFVIELFILFIYFYSNYVISAVYSTGSHPITLLNEPVFLNRITKLDYGKIYAYEEANNEGIEKNKTPSATDYSIASKHTYNNNYSVSMWVYINTQKTVLNNFQYNIFNYGRGKPQIIYMNESSTDLNNNDIYLDKILVKFSNTDLSGNTDYTFNMPKQKWNNIVINYSSNVADLFLNGVLIKSMDISKYIPNGFATDTIVTGSTYSLNGGICNVQYFPDVLTQSAIINNYNLLINKNPPIH